MNAVPEQTTDRGGRPRRRRLGAGRSGFTLIEMLVAFFVLATALAVLVVKQAETLRGMRLAQEMNIAAMLVRSKMMDIEQQLETEGFQSTIYTDHGDFHEMGWDNYRWEAEVEPVEIDAESQDQFVADITTELYGEGSTGEGTLSGSAAVSRYLPMIIGQVPEFINEVGERTRKIRLTVYWDTVAGEQKLTVNQYYTVLRREDAYLEGEGTDTAVPVPVNSNDGEGE
jgi:prepilin-type N-terminal cleavage/methylation domain-containing protein